MTRDNIDRLAMFSEGFVNVERIALNRDQVVKYNPPPNPAKMTDTRAQEYVASHGQLSWELDALNPKILNDLIETEIKRYVNMDLWKRTEESQDHQREELAKLYDNWDDVKTFLADL